MTSPQRIRVLTPEKLDTAAANLVNTAGTALATAVASKAGTSQGTAQGSSVATANSLMQRDAAARAQVADPSVAADIATKGYVDTTVGGYIPSSAKGTASGVATLDGSSFVSSAQLPAYLARQVGTGTALPASGNRQGDTFFHSGLGVLFVYDSAFWRQASVPQVANATDMTAMVTNWSPYMAKGFRIFRTDLNVTVSWNNTNWRVETLAVGTTNQRSNLASSALIDGMQWKDTDTGALWAWNGSTWRQIGEIWVANMQARPTASASLVGLRIRDAADPIRSYTCILMGGTTYAWVQDGAYFVGMAYTTTQNVFYRRFEGTSVTTTANASGGFNVAMGVTFAENPFMVTMVPGDNAGSLNQISNIGGNCTPSTLGGAAQQANGTSVGNGVNIRVNWMAIGYNT